jgi:hypothetical protein
MNIELKELFFNFLKNNLNFETIYFLNDVEEFEKLNNEFEKMDFSLKMIDKYLRNECEFEINISGKLKNKIVKNIENNIILNDLWLEAKNQIKC